MVDALSRQHEKVDLNNGQYQRKLLAVSISVPSWMQEISSNYEDDTQVKELISQISVNLKGPSIWYYSSGILRRKWKLYIGAAGGLRN